MNSKSQEYNTLHKRIRKKLGTPSLCVHCSKTDTDARYHWAHVHGAPYDDEESSWIRLCPRCHAAYDVTPEQRKRIASLGGQAVAGKPRPPKSEECKAKISATLKAKGIRPPSRKAENAEY